MACDKSCQDSVLLWANILSGFLTFAAIAISITQILQHMKHYSNPFFQNKTMMILFMAPFYALTSFLTIITKDNKGYFVLIRDIYEAILIYAFFKLLSSYLSYDVDHKSVDYERIYDMLATKGVKKHLFPMNYVFKDLLLISKIRGQWFFRSCRLYILQYLAIKPTATFLLILLFAFSAPKWIGSLINFFVLFSVTMSMYYLVLFYQILREELAYSRPLLKFLSIKSVLFFTFWQDIVLGWCKNSILGLFEHLEEEEGEFMISVLECLLICFEMMILSFITTIAFSYKDFEQTQRKTWLLDDDKSVMDLGKTFMKSVVSDNIVTTLEDLKELGNPIKDPFRKFQTTVITSSETKTTTEENEEAEEDLEGSQIKRNTRKEKDQHAHVFEKPRVIPDFLAQEKQE